MSFTTWANGCVQKLKWYDISLVKLSTLAFALLVAKLWPPILSLHWGWYVAITIVAAIEPARKWYG